VAEIARLAAPSLSVDEQRAGPFRYWHHEHQFEEIPGGVRVHDVVDYTLPLGRWGGASIGS